MDGLPLSSLPDVCILNVMTQLPPLARMHLAATCVRHRQIYKFGRLHSLVLGSSSVATPTPHLLSCADGCFPTLAAAVSHSRCQGSQLLFQLQNFCVAVVQSEVLWSICSNGRSNDLFALFNVHTRRSAWTAGLGRRLLLRRASTKRQML